MTDENREQAQHRVDRISGFREELRALEAEGALVLTAEQRARLESHHEGLLARLAGRFEVDRTEGQKRLSLGMRIVALLGAIALGAAGYYFFFRFWGGMGLAAQVAVLTAAPLLALCGMESAARRERALYFTGLLGVLSAVFFVINLSVLSGLSNVALSPTAMLAWSAFCWILAYAYGLRPLLIGSILFLMGFVATIANPAEVCVWDAFGRRPENFLPLGILLLAVPLIGPHRGIPSFKPVFRVLGLVSIFMPILILSSAGHASYLQFSASAVEVGYQLAGFALAGLTIWLGIRRAMSETTNLGSGFFVVLLYVKFFDWWWDWMPKWVFFLILGVVAIVLLLAMRRVHTMTRRASA